MFARKSFLDAKPPANYVAGVGRGAIGFTTRSDIGPATNLGFQDTSGNQEEEKEEDEEVKGWDDYEIPGEKNFAAAIFDREDEEAEIIYESVDRKLDERRKRTREVTKKKEIKEFRKKNPNISSQFEEYKKDMKKMSLEEWSSIPEIGDYTIKRTKLEEFRRAPDHLLNSARNSSSIAASIDPTSDAGETPVVRADFSQLNKAGKARLTARMEQLSESVTGQTVVDPKAFMDNLSGLNLHTDAEITEINRARELLKSLYTSNPRNAAGWIAAARVEELAGKLVDARNLCKEGTRHCPTSEDLWLENCRLQNPENARIVIADGVYRNPTSVKLWIRAVELEDDVKKQKSILRKALEAVPTSIILWKHAIELEEPEVAKILLGRAVEQIPTSADLWLALARIEDYENAKKVLNKAIRSIPAEIEIWLEACRLEERNGGDKARESIRQILTKAFEVFSLQNIRIDRKRWFDEAIKNEIEQKCVVLATEIIEKIISLEIAKEDLKAQWLEDAEVALKESCIEVARAIYRHSVAVFPGKKSFWIHAADLERKYGTSETLLNLLRDAVSHVPFAEVLWLMGAKQLWIDGRIDQARAILEEAFKVNPKSEQIWLAAFKLENENGENERATILLTKAREVFPTEKIWKKSVRLEKELGRMKKEKELLERGIELYPHSAKLWLGLAELHYTAGNNDLAASVYKDGLTECPESVKLWMSHATMEENNGNISLSRAILEKARMKVPASEILWRSAIRFELRNNNKPHAEILLAKALQLLPKSGLLHSEAIILTPEASRKAKVLHSLEICGEGDAVLFVTIARMFWGKRAHKSAKQWFDRALSLDNGLGDAYAYYYTFALNTKTLSDEEEASIMERAVAADPKKGELWNDIRKRKAGSHRSVKELMELASRICKPI